MGSTEWIPARVVFNHALATKFETLADTIPTPQATGSFGYVLWQILGEKTSSIQQAKSCLRISTPELYSFISGRKLVTQNLVNRNKWVQSLKQQHPAAWQKHGDVFLQKTAEIYKSDPLYVGKPSDDNQIALILWKILGGDSIDLEKSAQHLSITPRKLRNILVGQERVYQATLTEYKWRQKLSRHYPTEWRQNCKDFNRAALKLFVNAQHVTKKFVDNESLSSTLWKILGRDDIDREKAAKRLGVSETYLSCMIHGSAKVTSLVFRRNKWDQRLARHYKKTWDQYRDEFMQRAGFSVQQLSEPRFIKGALREICRAPHPSLDNPASTRPSDSTRRLLEACPKDFHRPRATPP